MPASDRRLLRPCTTRARLHWAAISNCSAAARYRRSASATFRLVPRPCSYIVKTLFCAVVSPASRRPCNRKERFCNLGQHRFPVRKKADQELGISQILRGSLPTPFGCLSIVLRYAKPLSGRTGSASTQPWRHPVEPVFASAVPTRPAPQIDGGVSQANISSLGVHPLIFTNIQVADTATAVLS